MPESINLPMNTYSVGIRSLLGFANDTLRVPEVILADEVLTMCDWIPRERSVALLRQIL